MLFSRAHEPRDMAYFIVAVLLSVLASHTAIAGEASDKQQYVPLFVVDMAHEPGTMSENYMKAYHSPSRYTAIQQWEAFLAEYVKNDTPTFEDITDQTLLRQAHYELMRLYYLAGRTTEADKILKKADDLVVYSVPDASEARRWCKRRNYCN